MGLSSSEDRMIVAGVVLAWYQRVTDGQTDRQTESMLTRCKKVFITQKTEFIPPSEMKCPKSGIFINIYWVQVSI